MKRIIKFKAWDTDRKVMYQPEQIEYIDFLNERIQFKFDIDIVNGQNSGHYRGTFERFLLLEFTGRKDANGVEIYEGDMMGTGKIAYSQFAAAFVLLAPTWEQPLTYASLNYRVIGNIHESRQLQTLSDKIAAEDPPFNREDYDKLKNEWKQFHNKADQDRQELLWLEVIEDCHMMAFDTINRRNRAEALMDKFIISKK